MGDAVVPEAAGAPVRPTPTPVFLAALGIWASCATCYVGARDLDAATCLAGALASGFAALALVACALCKRRLLGLFLLSGLLAGACLGFSAAGSLTRTSEALDYGETFAATLEVLEDSKVGLCGERALARITDGYGEGALVLADIGKVGEVRYGQLVSGACTLAETPEKTREYAWRKGAACTASVPDAGFGERTGLHGLLVNVRNGAIDSLGACGESGALLQALVCGYRRAIRDGESYARFQSCGLAHLVAVSGAHLVIVTGLLASLFQSVRLPRRMAVPVLLAVTGSYLVVAGMPVSALRAAAMSALGFTSIYARRRSSSMNALGVGIVVLLGISPEASISASFSLSVLSTCGIVVFSPLVGHLVGRTAIGKPEVVRSPLALTLSANLLTQLYSCALFCQLPLVSPLANVVCAPAFPLACTLGLAAAFAGIAFAPAAPAIGAAAGMAAGALEWMAALLSSIPYACVPFSIDVRLALALSALVAVAIWLAWPTRLSDFTGVLVAAATVAVAVILPAASADEVVLLDVGQGDAFLVKSRGATLLIDTGNQDKMLLEQLGSLHVAHIDSVLVTHADDDHCGSLDAIAKTVDVDRVILAEDMLGAEDESCKNLVAWARAAARDVVPVRYGDTFEIGAFEARVVWPHGFRCGGGNADSLCLVLSYDGDGDGTVDFTSFFTGDAEKDELAQIIADGDVERVDLLKVCHHGSRNGMTPEEADVLSPSVALIGVGKDNRYGHPTQEVLDMLASVGCKVFRSDEDGQVRCQFTPESIRAA